MKHYYTNIHGWFKFKLIYDQILDQFSDNTPSTFVEVGTWCGKSAIYMAVELINRNLDNIDFHVVDLWEILPEYENICETKNIYEQFLTNIEPIKNRINIHKGISWECASDFADNSCDFIFIDAGHQYTQILNDLNAWYPKLKSNGIIMGDDFHNKKGNGVKNAVKDFAAANQLTIIPYLNNSLRVWELKK